VQAKLQDENACPSNTCTFTYASAQTPTLTGITSASPLTWAVGSTVTLTGSGFQSGSGVTVYFSADLSLYAVATVLTDASLQFTIPTSLQASSVQALVYVQNVGYAGYTIAGSAYNFISVTIPLVVQSFTPTSGSRYGSLFYIIGSGFLPSLDSTGYNGNPVYLGSQPCAVVWQSATEIVADCFL
jgi:hypothetical protein